MKKGMTLIEVIIAMAILSTITLAVLSALSFSIIGIFGLGDTTVGVFDSQIIMENDVSDNPADRLEDETITLSLEIDSVHYDLDVHGDSYKHGELDMFLPKWGD